ncbi:MAG: hypothetical protein N5P05_003818 [Chroococcopsis gigantea SAG 12.99]|nr:DUF2127 domain-containing protein [Chlorogloea purpurea SAG 13.99]MDV3002212.1 hypothetical protein [Chroococcopsis gigantea SAG 12.99]
MSKRPLGLILIVIYKGIVALLLIAASIGIFLAVKKHQALVNFSESYIVEGKMRIIEWVLDTVIKLNPKTLLFSGLATGIYGVVTALEAVGLWYDRTWAKILVIALVAVSIPLEIYHLVHGLSFLKMGIFLVNVGVLIYLVIHFRKGK